jgi:hypothetical protein
MVLRVSTRRYAHSLEPLPPEVEVRGISKSAVSERFVVGTQRRLAELMQRDLSRLKLVEGTADRRRALRRARGAEGVPWWRHRGH